jgi:6-pyruvoyltetrahydropterin/6-carboxytetrahydropterin synthase
MGESALIRRVSFPAVHRYWVAAWSPERNREVFGATTESHAHTFQVEVEVVGPPDPVTGLILNLAQLDEILERRVVAPLSGRDLNEQIPEVAAERVQPSTEFLARWIWERVSEELGAPLRVSRVRVAESPDLSSEFRS